MHGIAATLGRLTLVLAAIWFVAGMPASVMAEDPALVIHDIEEARTADGVRLLALTPGANAMLDISVLPPTEGLNRIEAALDLIARKSPANRQAIQRLKAAGQVSIVYYPNNFRDRNRLNTQTVALFIPDFLEKRGMGGARREFSVVINQFGVKWPADELAAVIAHELAGHGIQHLEGRIATARPLDLECEASLFQEQAYQDFGVAKKLRTVVLFRRQMEYRYCADFRDYMRNRMPKKLAIWDSLNPDVAGLLDIFRSYSGTQAARRNDGSVARRSALSSRNR